MDIHDKILNMLKLQEQDMPITQIAKHFHMDRHTVAKHLESMNAKGLVDFRIVGKSKMWTASKNSFISAITTNADFAKNIKGLFKHMDGQVSIQTKNKMIWSNDDKNGCKAKDKCDDCVVDKTFKTGISTSVVKNWPNRRVQIITEPIKDNKNNTIAVVEIVKDVKRK